MVCTFLWCAEALCILLDEMLTAGIVSVGVEDQWQLLGVTEALVSCCDLSKLRQTGRLVAHKRSYLHHPNLHAIVAPMLFYLGWARREV